MGSFVLYLDKVKCFIFVIYGKDDFLVLVEGGKDIVKYIFYVEFDIIDGMGYDILFGFYERILE